MGNAYTGYRSGNWSRTSDNADSPWYDGGTQSGWAAYPGDGDTITSLGAFTVTIQTGEQMIVGNSPSANTAVMTIPNGGNLTIQAGTALDTGLKVRGSVVMNASAAANDHYITVGAGSYFYWDNTLAATPSAATYRISGTSNWQFVFNGSSSQHCACGTLLGASGAPACMTMNTNGRRGVRTATYTDFSNIGTTLVGGVGSSMDNADTTNWSITNCTFTACNYQAITYGAAWDGVFTFDSNVFTSSVRIALGDGNHFAVLFNIISSPTSGSRSVTRNQFDRGVHLRGCNSLTLQYNLLTRTDTAATEADGSWAHAPLIDSNIFQVVYANQGGDGIVGSISNCHYINTSSGASNCEGLLIGIPTSDTTTFSMTGCVFEQPNSASASGNAVIMLDPGVLSTVLVRNNLFLPNGSNKTVGAAYLDIANTDHTRVYFEHNTAQVENQWMMEAGHMLAINARFQSFKANLAYGTGSTGELWAGTYSGALTGTVTATNGSASVATTANLTSSLAAGATVVFGSESVYYTVLSLNSTTITLTANYVGTGGAGLTLNHIYVDQIAPANADYNGKYLLKLTDGTQPYLFNQGGSYVSAWSVTPGANDVTGDPQFVDGTRSLQKWGQNVAGVAAGSDNYYTNTIAYLMADASTRIPAMMGWVKGGFRPQNPAFNVTFPGDSSTADAAGNNWTGAQSLGAMAFLSLSVNSAATKGDATTGGEGCAINVYLGRSN